MASKVRLDQFLDEKLRSTGRHPHLFVFPSSTSVPGLNTIGVPDMSAAQLRPLVTEYFTHDEEVARSPGHDRNFLIVEDSRRRILRSITLTDPERNSSLTRIVILDHPHPHL